jgi:methylmalonyl-CoA/ethylmalonyl-CoA epimerase
VNLAPSDLEFELRGRPVSCALALGFARSGNVQIEVIQPVRGEGIHVEFLARYGPGAHHLGFLVDDLDALEASATVEGFPKVMSGHFDTVRLSYLDTFDALGLYVELIEDPDGMLMGLMPWRDPPASG